MDRTTEDGWDGQMSLETGWLGFQWRSRPLVSGGHWLHKMADGEEDVESRKRFVFNENTEEFEAPCHQNDLF